MFNRKPQSFFSEQEQNEIVEAIQHAEKQTSGEIRVFIESKCRFLDALDRAREIFANLQMQNTQSRNAVLLYVALKDRQLAVYGDEGIHQLLGDDYWNSVVMKMIAHFNKENFSKGISECITEIGMVLKSHFPYNEETDKNELPDEIIFGK